MSEPLKKIRLSVCFDCTVEVSGDSTEAVSIQEAKDAVSFALPYALDGEDFLDAMIAGVCNITSEAL